MSGGLGNKHGFGGQGNSLKEEDMGILGNGGMVRNWADGTCGWLQVRQVLL